MAIRDMFGRDIEVGDIVIFMANQIRAVQVLAIEEPSQLIPQGQPAIGKMTLAIQFDQPLINMQRTSSLQFNDLAIVRKFTEFAPPKDAPKQ